MYSSVATSGLLLALALCQAANGAGSAVLRDAQAAEKHGDYAAAQHLYEAYLKEHPKDAAFIRKLAGAMFFQQKLEGQRKTQDSYRMLQEAYKIDGDKTQMPALVFVSLCAEYGDFRNAKVMADYAIKQGADEPATCLALARWAAEWGNLALTIEQTDRVLANHPGSREVTMSRGKAAIRKGEFKTAFHYFEAAASQSPDDFEARNGMALALCELGDPDSKAKALTIAKTNIEKKPKEPAAIITYAGVLFHVGRVADAEKLTSSIDTVSTDLSAESEYYVACIAAERGLKEEAAEMILRMVRPFSYSEPPNELKRKAISLFRKMYPGVNPEKLKPYDTVVVVSWVANGRSPGMKIVDNRGNAFWISNGPIYPDYFLGERLKVVNVDKSTDGLRVFVRNGKGEEGAVYCKDVSKL